MGISRRLFLDDRGQAGGEGDVGTIGRSEDGILGIGTVGDNLEVIHFIDGFAVGVAVIVINAAGNDGIPGLYGF